jgi:pyridoxine 5-phosphate synthase
VRLHVNVDHVATVRQARGGDQPDPVAAARAALTGGADGITFHLREDRRHISDRDARRLVAELDTVTNFECAARADVVALACELRPSHATLVPESRQELTTEGGLALDRPDPALADAVRRLADAGIPVALFIDPDRLSVDRARDLGVPAVELHTGRYANSGSAPEPTLEQLRRAAEHAQEIGLIVHAGHGLTPTNVAAVAAIPAIEELNIGHSIVARSITIGIGPATREMRELIDGARR